MLDANASRAENKGVINRLQTSCHLTIVAPNDISENLNSHKRGTKQIDFIMTTQRITKLIHTSTVQSFDEVCHSDHRSMVIDINMSDIKLNNNQNNNVRQLITNTPNQVRQYKQEVYKNIQKDPLKSEIQLLAQKIKNNNICGKDITLINSIDQSFSSIRLNAEKHLKNAVFHMFFAFLCPL